MKKLFFIYNPKAGRGTAQGRLEETIEFFTKMGYLVTVYPTQGDYHFEVLKDEIPESAEIVYAGGDGMLNAAVNFQLRYYQRGAISYIPVGTTNDFARSLGISVEYEKALRSALEGQTIRLDIGRLNKQYFVYVAAFGAFTSIPYLAPQDAKNMFGYLAYVLEGMKRLSDLKTYHLQIDYLKPAFDEVETGDSAVEASKMITEQIEGDFLLGLITNSFSVAGLRSFIPEDVSLTDGMFEVLLIKRPQGIMELTDIAASLIAGNLETENFISFKSGKITVCSQEEIDWTIDGEYGGKWQRAEVEVVRGGMQVRC